MFSSKESKNKVEKLHERVLQIIHDDFSSPYETLLLKDNSTTIHKRNLKFLMTEILKNIDNENPSFMKEIFAREDSMYNLRFMFRLRVPRVLATKNGLETLSFRGIQIWNSLSNNLKELNMSCRRLQTCNRRMEWCKL